MRSCAGWYTTVIHAVINRPHEAVKRLWVRQPSTLGFVLGGRHGGSWDERVAIASLSSGGLHAAKMLWHPGTAGYYITNSALNAVSSAVIFGYFSECANPNPQ